MKRYFIVLLLICFGLPDIATAQSAKEAVLALKKLEARVQSGVSYRDYGQALGDAKFPVNLYLESEDKKNPALVESIKKTMEHYEVVGRVWQWCVENHSGNLPVDIELGKMVISRYPETGKTREDGGALVSSGSYGDRLVGDDVYPIVWNKASEELKITTALLSKVYKTDEGFHLSNWQGPRMNYKKEEISPERIKQEEKLDVIEDDIKKLKNENKQLKIENQKLKEEVKKLKELSSQKE